MSIGEKWNPHVSEAEIDAALIGLGFSKVAAISVGACVSESDLRTDMRSALQAFVRRASYGVD